ncbi:zinc finger SWIM domain-containing protein 8 homolog [Daphnia carinata]|uniref:zinc finger SWIM domain-containing protein 8 homolog n=1 Tax=Daphnia carinata TaxID=120202 RepID=UPI002868F7D8|nr:zinc finger SWIM domain-containing protein 8 homolog [Daphnia carinata]
MASLSASPRESRTMGLPAAQGAVPQEPCVVTVPNRNGGVFGELNPLDDPLEILFASAEGLHAHGHSSEACELGIELATELLANTPDLMVELPPVITQNGKKMKTNPACHQISFGGKLRLLPSRLQGRNVWIGIGTATCYNETIRSELAHQESELVTLLKRIPLGHP